MFGLDYFRFLCRGWLGALGATCMGLVVACEASAPAWVAGDESANDDGKTRVLTPPCQAAVADVPLYERHRERQVQDVCGPLDVVALPAGCTLELAAVAAVNAGNLEDQVTSFLLRTYTPGHLPGVLEMGSGYDAKAQGYYLSLEGDYGQGVRTVFGFSKSENQLFIKTRPAEHRINEELCIKVQDAMQARHVDAVVDAVFQYFVHFCKAMEQRVQAQKTG